MVNQAAMEAGLALCAAPTSLPLLQDTPDAAVWTALGATYNSLIIVDQAGRLAARIASLALPASAPEIEALIAGLLGP
jgi:hypothetical protein